MNREEERRRAEIARGAGPRHVRVEGAGERLQRLRERAQRAPVSRGELAAAWSAAAAMSAIALGTWLFFRRRAPSSVDSHYLHGIDVTGTAS